MINFNEYDIKILLAFGKSIDGHKDFFKWLLKNGYPELAALSNAIRGDEEALQWLLKNGFPELAVLSNAIDNEPHAKNWLIKSKNKLLFQFAMASRGDDDAIKWLRVNDLRVFIYLAEKINKVLKLQVKENTFWYKMKF